MPITLIGEFEYVRVWKKWFDELGLVLLYKFKHEFNDAGLRHVHYHGCFFSSKGRVDYSKLVFDGYSVRLENPYKCNYDRWHEYCMHEIKKSTKDMKTKLEEEHGRKVLQSVYDYASTYSKPKQMKIKISRKSNALSKITITGSI